MSTTIGQDAVEFVYGSASGITVGSGGTLEVEASGVASGAVVQSGGNLPSAQQWHSQRLYPELGRDRGGAVLRQHLTSAAASPALPTRFCRTGRFPSNRAAHLTGVELEGPRQFVRLERASVTGTILSSLLTSIGPTAYVYSGATAAGTIVYVGTEDVYSGTATGTVLSGKYASQIVFGGTATGTVIVGGSQSDFVWPRARSSATARKPSMAPPLGRSSMREACSQLASAPIRPKRY